jgi:hypothetical protein
MHVTRTTAIVIDAQISSRIIDASTDDHRRAIARHGEAIHHRSRVATVSLRSRRRDARRAMTIADRPVAKNPAAARNSLSPPPESATRGGNCIFGSLSARSRTVARTFLSSDARLQQRPGIAHRHQREGRARRHRCDGHALLARARALVHRRRRNEKGRRMPAPVFLKRGN